MDLIQSFAKRIPDLHSDCDVSNRLSSVISVFVIFLLAGAISLKQIIGDSITCFTPNEFTGAQSSYVASMCWVMNTYYIPGTEMPKNVEDRKDAEISYYQWIPYVLLLQAMLFYLPYCLWTLLNWHSGIHVSKVVRMAIDVEHWKEEEDKGLRLLADYLHCLFSYKKSRKTGACANFTKCLSKMCLYYGKRYGNVLVIVFFLIKILFVVNAVGQLFIIHKFLDAGKGNFTLWGIEALQILVSGKQWRETGLFPRSTLCDFEVRRYANVHRYTVQCVLPINLFSEKIYIFLWFWCCFVGIVSVLSAILWTYRMCCRRQRIGFVKNYLMMSERSRRKKFTNDQVIRFVEQHLRYDGVLILRLVVCNAGDLIAARLVDELWGKWISRRTLVSKAEDNQELISNLQVSNQPELSTRPTSPESSTSNTSNKYYRNHTKSRDSNITQV